MSTPFGDVVNELEKSIPGLGGYGPPRDALIALAHIAKADELAYHGMDAKVSHWGLDGKLVAISTGGSLIEVPFEVQSASQNDIGYKVGPVVISRLRDRVVSITIDEIGLAGRINAKSITLEVNDGGDNPLQLPYAAVPDGAALIWKIRAAVGLE